MSNDFSEQLEISEQLTAAEIFEQHFPAKKFSPHTDAALTPMQVAAAYDFPKGIDVSKRKVAILELGGAFNIKDVVSYCQKYNLPFPQLSTYFVDGALEAASQADGEVCLDIDVIAAAAPGVKIAVIFAPNSNQGFIDGMAKCLELDPDAVSISWGSSENNWDAPSMQALDALFLQAEEKGINVFVAAGDNGSSDGEMLGNHCDYPASSPYVIACGGTKLTLNPDGTRASETAWSTSLLNSSGGGGGISAIYKTTPAYQAGALPDKPAGRRVPDLSGNADPSTGYLVDIDGQIQQVGGTSAVAPLMAAYQCILNAIAGKHVGNMHQKIYSAPAGCFYDVTQGSNGGFNAGSGYDAVAGIGVIHGAAFAETIPKE